MEVDDRAYAIMYMVACRPLAGTRRRGQTPEDDEALEKELLADAKECSEHVMLVDLGRNDVGKVLSATMHFWQASEHGMHMDLSCSDAAT